MSDRAVDDVIEAALQSLWSVVNELAAVRPARRDYSVSIFGSARIRPGDRAYEDVKWLAAELARRGVVIVTGGGPGLMQAANEGEQLGDPSGARHSVGIRVELPFEQGANAWVEQAYLHRSFFTRLHHFVRLSSAFVVTPGGIGTTLEALMVWQLLQVKHIHDVPLVFVGPMWRDLVAWAKQHMLGPQPLASADDLELPCCVDDVRGALAIVERHLATSRARIA